MNQVNFREVEKITLSVVPPAGIEPALPHRNGILNPARLPVPPGGQQLLKSIGSEPKSYRGGRGKSRRKG